MTTRSASMVAICLANLLLHSRAALAQAPGDVLWTFPAGSYNCPIPAIAADDTIYVAAYRQIYALTPAGTNLWQFQSDGFQNTSPVVGDDGTIYFGCDDGKVYALDLNGSLKWAAQTGYDLRSAPALGPDQTIYVHSDDGKAYAFAPNGAKKWDYLIGQGISAPTVGKDGTIYFSTFNQVFALKANGTLNWTSPTRYYYNATASIGADDTIYFCSGGSAGFGCVSAFSPDGLSLWSHGFGLQSSVALGTNGTIYTVALWPTALTAIDPTTQTDLWVRGGGENPRGYLGIPSTPAVAADGVIYYGSLDYNRNAALYAINPDGTTNWIFATGGGRVGSPTVARDGTIYVVADVGFFALKGNAPLAKRAWPKLGQNLRNTGKVERPKLFPASCTTNGFQCLVFGEVGWSYAVEGSTNLTEWTTLTNFVAETNRTLYSETAIPGAPQRFYRVVSPAQ